LSMLECHLCLMEHTVHNAALRNNNFIPYQQQFTYLKNCHHHTLSLNQCNTFPQTLMHTLFSFSFCLWHNSYKHNNLSITYILSTPAYRKAHRKSRVGHYIQCPLSKCLHRSVLCLRFVNKQSRPTDNSWHNSIPSK
jgi:hypothetical protein